MIFFCCKRLLSDKFYSYINFANGDEDLEAVYGANLPRLQALKQKYDPTNVFDQWFPLIPRRQITTS